MSDKSNLNNSIPSPTIPSIAFVCEFHDALMQFADAQTAVNVAVQSDPAYGPQEWLAADRMQSLVVVIDNYFVRQLKYMTEKGMTGEAI